MIWLQCFNHNRVISLTLYMFTVINVPLRAKLPNIWGPLLYNNKSEPSPPKVQPCPQDEPYSLEEMFWISLDLIPILPTVANLCCIECKKLLKGRSPNRLSHWRSARYRSGILWRKCCRSIARPLHSQRRWSRVRSSPRNGHSVSNSSSRGRWRVPM